ncbi:non-ribosomal peptide synthetase [Burkholderia cenocepacia]|uniref:non-ribosomal peptide synthetase n=1 Tax=Burkholderia cenocepacia TaxID=95486 RepID=UPI001B9237D0|nr:non-ribosomal peptide synthetase [Burkholderia cenocepacia]MBR8114859.1 amino acid adenylation domain-containing protein [Burkholderia cenocepacia]MBR8135579.1 amino acid adenylation domain-containing protein [Burkholderia cenocepacia]MBR8369708.1 amino acid adenylation domain-containing protein [Burkholderia cenocepacia]MBR8382731.1 amino acid adenylation domain-containing protein [Burkholderia cenocepacia]MBR8437848.1 amino acid adenylation domain-containing protein [Burkholderia cenocepa
MSQTVVDSTTDHSDPSCCSPTDCRAQLVALIAELLDEAVDEIASLDDDEDLLSCGLDSIRLMYLQTRLNRLGHALTFDALARTPTLGAWTALLATAPRIARAEAVVAAEAVDVHAPFELSAVQQAYWLGRGDGEVLGNVSCHAFLEFRSRAIDPVRLDTACRRVRERHPMLRARFDGGRQQIVAAPDAPVFAHADWRDRTAAEAEAEWASLRAFRSHECLDVEHAQVFMMGLVQMPGGEDRVWLSVDLLAADVDSVRLLMQEIGVAYAEPSALPAAPSTWFPAWLARRAADTRDARAAARDAWQAQLATLPEGPALPLARAPETIRAPRFSRVAHTLSTDELTRLQARAAQHGVTLSSVFGAAFAAVLARWSGRQAFLLNVPLFDRHGDAPDLGRVIADFTTLLLVECDVHADASAADTVRAFQQRLHGAIAQAAYPALDVLRDARRQGTPRAAPVVFSCNLGDEPFVPAAFAQVFGDLHDMISQTPQVWLDHQLYRVPGGALLAWDSVDGLFPDGMIDAMFGAYVAFVQALCDRDWRLPIAVELPSAQRRVRDALNALPAPGRARTLHHDFFALAAREPAAVAVRCGDRAVTRGELAAQALAIAGGLRAAGIGHGDAVEISLPRGPEQVAAVFGVLAAGACYVPLDIAQPVARKALIERAAGVKAAIVDTACADGPLPYVGIAALLRHAPLAAPLEVAPQATAYVIYTSGSTGVPKGVEMTHAAAVNTIDAIDALLGVRAHDRLLAVSALDFDLSVYDLFGALGAGAQLVLPTQDEARDAARWIELIAQHRVTLWNSAPALLEMALAVPAARDACRSVRAALLSGDWIALDLPARLRERCGDACAFHALGGATEAGIWSNVQTVRDVPPHWRSIPYGRPLPGQAYRVVDGDGRDVPDYVPGELLIGGDSLARGYRNDPELTAQRFVQHASGRWYRTGDRGRYWPDGTLEFLGREDRQVKVRGHRIELGEIEAALAAHPLIDGACASVVHGEAARIVAAFVPADCAAADTAPSLLAAVDMVDTMPAETAVAHAVAARLLDGDAGLPPPLLAHWRAKDAASIPIDDALDRLAWQATDLDALTAALRTLAADPETAAQRVPLDPCVAPLAFATRLPDGVRALREFAVALDAQAAAHTGAPRVAVLDARAGQALDAGLGVLDDPRFDVTLFDVSPGLLHNAQARFTRTLPALQTMQDGLLPARHLGAFDCVISFAAAHLRDDPRDTFRIAAALLARDGRLLLADVLRDSPLRELVASVAGDTSPPRPFADDALAAAAHACGFALDARSWRSTAFACLDARRVGEPIAQAALADWLRDRLPDAMRPDALWCAPRWPLNANGKIDRRTVGEALARALGDTPAAHDAFVPASERHAILLACWEQALGSAANARDATFFALGGDSLLATRLLAQLRERLGVRIGMAAFYRQPTLAGLAAQLDELTPAAPADGDAAVATIEEGVL